ncbi:hypothetical protein YDYSY3_08270 [Paenibacillus chitinolyticus]|nr:hypothetical protein YDYSY3_08270 [Paenibacillus chitinolyticus]
MDVVYSRVCGLDVHKKNIVACTITPEGKEIRTFVYHDRRFTYAYGLAQG